MTYFSLGLRCNKRVRYRNFMGMKTLVIAAPLTLNCFIWLFVGESLQINLYKILILIVGILVYDDFVVAPWKAKLLTTKRNDCINILKRLHVSKFWNNFSWTHKSTYFAMYFPFAYNSEVFCMRFWASHTLKPLSR